MNQTRSMGMGMAILALLVITVAPTVMAGFAWDQTSKVTLSDQSDRGPALAWDAHLSKMFLAWRGTDSNHQINVESSTDYKTWSNKVTLSTAAGGDDYIGMAYDSNINNQKLYISYCFEEPFPNSANYHGYIWP